METTNTPAQAPYNKDNKESKSSISGRVFGGLALVLIGVLFLARKMGFDFPDIIFSWEVILIGIGLYVGIRHSFRGPVWAVLILIGVVFLLDDIYPEYDIDRYLWPVVIISIGLVMIFRPQKKKNGDINWSAVPVTSTAGSIDDEVIDSVAVFGGIKRNIISKNFRGGETVTVFGGTELNLSQADATGPMVLEMTQIFAGAKLIVPPHWKIQSDDVVCILGGLDDKRPMYQQTNSTEPQRVLILKGTCIFGGIDIKSF